MSNDIEAGKNIEDEILRKQIRLAVQQIPSMQGTSFIIALVLCYTVRNSVPYANILIWLLMILSIVISRVVFFYRFSKVREGPFPGEYWRNMYLVLAFVSGLFWGLSAFIIFPVGNPKLTSLFVLVMASLSAATTVSHSSIKPAPIAWAASAMLIYAIRCVMEGGEYGYTLSVLICLYLLMIVRYSYIHNNSITSSIAVQFENRSLLGEMQELSSRFCSEIIEHKQVQQVLRESEERYRSLFENSFDGILLTTPEGSILEANPAACGIFRMSEEEICRVGRRGLVDSADPGLAKLLQERARTGKATAEFTHMRKDGTRFPAEVSSVFFKGSDGSERTCTIIRDISARKKGEDALRRSEANLQVIIEATADGILAVDEKGKLIKANRRFAELWKIPQHIMQNGDDAMLLESVMDQLVDPGAFLEKVRTLYGTSYEEKDTLHFRDGRVFERFSAPLMREGNIIGRVWSFRDITRSKQFEEMLRENEEFLTTIVENIPNMIFVKEAKELRFVRFNKAGENLLGYSREELIGKNDHDFFPEDEAAFFTQVDRKVLRSGILEDIEEEPIETRHGGKRILHTKKLPIYDDQGNPQYLLGISEDITQRKRAEEEIKSYMQKLEQSNQSLQHFAHIASHDLQEPLRTVSSFVQLLERRYKGRLDADADEFISFAVDGAKRMQSLINDLLAYSRVETQGKPFEATEMEIIFLETTTILQAGIEESGAIVTHDPLPSIPADSSQMTQLLQNLIGNGLKFHSDSTPRVHVSARLCADEWLFSVKDNGIGIDEEFSERIFKIFQRLHTREEYSGTGIGLAICKKIVERHGGRIWVESQPKAGSTFFFTIPHRLKPAGHHSY